MFPSILNGSSSLRSSAVRKMSSACARGASSSPSSCQCAARVFRVQLRHPPRRQPRKRPAVGWLPVTRKPLSVLRPTRARRPSQVSFAGRRLPVIPHVDFSRFPASNSGGHQVRSGCLQDGTVRRQSECANFGSRSTSGGCELLHWQRPQEMAQRNQHLREGEVRGHLSWSGCGLLRLGDKNVISCNAHVDLKEAARESPSPRWHPTHFTGALK